MLSPNDRSISSGPSNRVRARRFDRGADPPTSVEVGTRIARALAYAVFPAPDALEKLVDLYAGWPRAKQDETAFLTCLPPERWRDIAHRNFTLHGLAPIKPPVCGSLLLL
jgi:hypothetical protein